MPRTPWILGALLVAGCHAEVVESPPVAAGADASVPETGSTRVQVRVLGCLPVGYGASCRCEVDGGGAARLEACVGSGDTLRLEAWLEKHSGALPLSMWMDLVPAPATSRYCGILIHASGEAQRVVGFERAGDR